MALQSSEQLLSEKKIVSVQLSTKMLAYFPTFDTRIISWQEEAKISMRVVTVDSDFAMCIPLIICGQLTLALIKNGDFWSLHTQHKKVVLFSFFALLKALETLVLTLTFFFISFFTDRREPVSHPFPFPFNPIAFANSKSNILSGGRINYLPQTNVL